MELYYLIKEVGLAKALIPYSPGVFCAIGCLVADFRRDFVQTVNEPLEDVGVDGINDIFSKYAEQGKQDLVASGITFTDIVTRFEAEMHYEGQLHTIKVPFDSLPSSQDAIMEAFNRAYSRRFRDILEGMKTRVVNLRCTVLGIRPKIDLQIGIAQEGRSMEDSIKGVRQVYFDGAFMNTNVYERSKIPRGETIHGPAIIEQRDSVTIVEPGSKIWVDPYYNLILEVQ